MKSVIVFAHRNKEGKVIRVALDAVNVMQVVEDDGKAQIVNDMGQAMLAENAFEDIINALTRANVEGYAEAGGTEEHCAQPQLLMPSHEIVVPRVQ